MLHSQSTGEEQVQRPVEVLAQWLANQRGGLAEWVPVFLGLGVGCYFALPYEPPFTFWCAISIAVLGVFALGQRINPDLRPVATAICIVLIGLSLAGVRTWLVQEPILAKRYYGPVQGRIVSIDKSASDAVRLTLDQVLLARLETQETPMFVRVSLHGTQGYFDPEPGQIIGMTAHLSAPSGPVEPDGFDFQRQAYFRKLGAIGYTRTPVVLMQTSSRRNASLWLEYERLRASRAIRTHITGDAGAFAAAIMTGDRSAIPASVTESLRASNLSHLLAISGLHMGLLTGFVFSLCRYLLLLWPRFALRYDIRKIAAILALASGATYLALSGGNVATLRAFVMVGVMYVAALIGRRAITLRSVAVAATIILVLTPEALTGPGFQMSFAATTALVGVFGWLQVSGIWQLPRWIRIPLVVFLSSLIAGLATAPVAAAHFNRFSNFGLLANLLSVPLMGLVVMPGAVIAAVLAPLGLAGVGLSLMAPAIEWILEVASHISAWENAVRYLIAPPSLALPLLAIGGLWIILIRGGIPARLPGVAVAMLAFWHWGQAQRPDILISDRGSLVGLMTQSGRALSKAKGDGFVAAQWLENDGDSADQDAASQRSGPMLNSGASPPAQLMAHVTGRDGAARANAACKNHLIVVTTAYLSQQDGECRMIDAGYLTRNGAVAVTVDGASIDMTTVRKRRGVRPWTAP